MQVPKKVLAVAIVYGIIERSHRIYAGENDARTNYP